MTGSVLLSTLVAVVLVNVGYVTSVELSDKVCILKDKVCKGEDVSIKHTPTLHECKDYLTECKESNNNEQCRAAVLNERHICHVLSSRCTETIDAPGHTYLYRLYDNEEKCPEGFMMHEPPAQLYSDVYCATVGKRCPHAKLYNCPLFVNSRQECENKCNEVVGCAMYDYQPTSKECYPVRQTCSLNELLVFTITNNYRRLLTGRTCNDGGWGEWKDDQPCSATCGGGMKLQTRLCNNPAPFAGGKPCEGKWFQEVPCNQDPCPAPPISYCREHGKKCASHNKEAVINKGHIFDQTAQSCGKLCESISGCHSYIYRTTHRWCFLLAGICRVEELTPKVGYDYYYPGCPVKHTKATCQRSHRKCVMVEQKGWINSAGTAENCMSVCNETPICKSANYDPIHGHCWLLADVCTELQLQDSHGWGDYYYPPPDGKECPKPDDPIPSA